MIPTWTLRFDDRLNNSARFVEELAASAMWNIWNSFSESKLRRKKLAIEKLNNCARVLLCLWLNCKIRNNERRARQLLHWEFIKWNLQEHSEQGEFNVQAYCTMQCHSANVLTGAENRFHNESLRFSSAISGSRFSAHRPYEVSALPHPTDEIEKVN